MRVLKDIYYSLDEIKEKTLDAYIPDGDIKAVFLYMHGGGLTCGSKSDSADMIAEHLASQGIGYVTVEYRMYPTAKYPDFINDCAEAVAWCKNTMRELFGTERLYVGGSSAGGYLSMMLCFDKSYLERVGLSPDAIDGYFHDAGQPTAHFNVLKFSGIDHRRVIIDETAPLYHVGKEEKYPRMRFIVSDNDMKNRYEQTMLMLSTLSHFGYTDYDHVVMHGTHCHYICKRDEHGESVFGEMISDFINNAENSKA